MPTWPPISRDDLRVAAGDAGFDTVFPLLVRRLIAETADGLVELNMPGGSGTAIGGFDGVATVVSDSQYVPSGVSVWELSVAGGAQTKADEDYGKRTDGPGGRPSAEVTYIQVILAAWTKAEVWATSRTQQGRWKAVRSYNLDAVHNWLERAPATTAWLAEQRGKALPGVRPLDQWWDDTWLPSTRVPLAGEIVLAGRKDAAETLLTALDRGTKVLSVGGDLPFDELRAFVAAALRAVGTARSVDLQARTLAVNDPHTLSQLIKQPQPLVLILSDTGLAADLPMRHPHQLVLPAPHGGTADVVVPPVDSQAVEAALRDAGEGWERASALGALARRSVLGLRRALALHPVALTPAWATTPDATRRRLLLLGGWDGASDDDRSIVERCAGRPYAEVQEAALALSSSSDSPMVGHVDERWYVLAPEDAWLLLGPYLTRDDVSALAAATESVLLECDPLIGLHEEARLSAQMAGSRRRYSDALREGLAQSLALIGSTDTPIPASGQVAGTDRARFIIRGIFEKANNDNTYALWASLGDVLSLLAEAAPDAFLRAMRDGLAEPPLHAKMFADEPTQGTWAHNSPHSSFLWALELLAWSPEYFDDTVDVLARLATLDPDGRLSNRPNRGLAEICSVWHPNTSADAAQRTRALKRLLRDQPTVGRQLLYDLIPGNGGFQLAHSGPRFRTWKEERPVTRADLIAITDTIVEMLLEDLDEVAERYLAFIARIDDVSAAHRRKFSEKLISLGSTLQFDNARAQLYDALRAKCAHHREYADAAWALPEEDLVVLDAAAAAVQPRQAVRKAAWLFESDFITLGDLSRRDDFEAYDRAVRERRVDAIGQVLSEGGLDAVAELAAGTSYPQVVGTALAQHTPVLDADMLGWLSDPAVPTRDAAYAYLSVRLRKDGPSLRDELLSLTGDNAKLQATILRATYDPPAAWAKLAELPEPVGAEYWLGFIYFGLGGNFDAALEAARGLLSAKRYAAVIDLMGLYERKVDSAEGAELTAQACEGILAAESTDPELRRLSSNDFERAFALLARHRDSVGQQRIINIEWQFFPALGYQAQAPSLHTALSEQPQFFAELVRHLYRSDDGPDVTDVETSDPSDAGGGPSVERVANETSGARRALASRAFEVLRSWRTCPGLTADGTVNYSGLADWVSAARAQLTHDARLRPGDSEIGQILAFAPPDDDGSLPPRAVRDLLEEVRSDAVDHGLALGVLNKRGVTSRGLLDGGKQEWDLASEFRRQAEGAQAWPRTRKLLRELAESYERDARREDEEAERRRRGLHD